MSFFCSTIQVSRVCISADRIIISSVLCIVYILGWNEFWSERQKARSNIRQTLEALECLLRVEELYNNFYSVYIWKQPTLLSEWRYHLSILSHFCRFCVFVIHLALLEAKLSALYTLLCIPRVKKIKIKKNAFILDTRVSICKSSVQYNQKFSSMWQVDSYLRHVFRYKTVFTFKFVFYLNAAWFK
jgi:hypothetical protein